MKDLFYKSIPVSGHLQTFLASFFGGTAYPSRTCYVPLSDGDILAPELLLPEEVDHDKPIFFLSPGICGSHFSPYIQRIGKKLARLGFVVVVANHRGMAGSKKMCKGVYHPGSSGDLLATVEYFREIFPKAPFYLAGFSMGANLIIKMLGELGSDTTKGIAGFVSVEPPVDLIDTFYRFMRPENYLYERYFSFFFHQTIDYRHKQFPELGEHEVSADMDLVEILRNYVAPQSGFTNLSNLCKAASGKYHISNITVPGYVVFAGDDPIVSANGLEGVYIPQGVKVLRYGNGGHMGFFGKFPHFFWLDHCVLSLLQKLSTHTSLKQQ